jgi:hypothetical protein
VRTNYVLIDYENLQPELLEALDLEHFRVMVFIGANQPKVSVDFASSLQRLGTRAQYVRISGSGRNALDFHIAYYIGELAARNPDSFFHIVSGDKGFAPLLLHLKDRRIYVRQCNDIGDIPHVKAANSKTLAAKVAFVRECFGERVNGHPVTLKALQSFIGGMFPGGLDVDVCTEVVKELAAGGLLTVEGTKVKYSASG